jgi:hypothetical protein
MDRPDVAIRAILMLMEMQESETAAERRLRAPAPDSAAAGEPRFVRYLLDTSVPGLATENWVS